jgi:hypothetical protein
VQEGADSGPARRQTQQQGKTVGLPPKHSSYRTPDWAGRPDCETAGRAYLIVAGHRRAAARAARSPAAGAGVQRRGL